MKDKIEINTDFMKGVIGGVLTKKLKTSTGATFKFDISELSAESADDDYSVRLHLNIDVIGDRGELFKFIS